MHLRHCPRCKLLALSGTYCAGCGAHLDGPVVTGVTRRHATIFAIVILAGIILGFALGMLGIFQSNTSLSFTLTPTVANCSGTVAYTAALASHETPLDDQLITIETTDGVIESLRTDRNGRVSSSFPYRSSWCGMPTTVRTVYRGAVRNAPAVTESSLLERLPLVIDVYAATVVTANTATPIAVRVADGYDGTLIAGALVRLETTHGEKYGLTDDTGVASFALTFPAGTETLHVTALGDARYGRVEAPAVTLTVAEASLTDRVAAMQRSVVTVRTGVTLGSAVVLATNDAASLLITNQHVLENSTLNAITIADGSGRTVGAQRIGFAPNDHDLAVIITDEPIGVAAAIDDRTPARGETVVAIGNPLGFLGSVSTGVVSNLVPMQTGSGATFVALQTDAAVNPGNSGGGLFDEDRGTLLGIITTKQKGAEGIGFAISIATLQDLPAAASWH